MPRPHVDSWYAATANAHPSHPELTGDVTADVAVVGGGFTGLSAALTLAERGYDVVLLEAEQIGWGASGRNGGHIASGFNKPMSRIEGWVGRDDAARLWALDREARALIRDRVARYGIDCDLRWGHLSVAPKRRQLDELREALDERSAYGDASARLVERDELRTLLGSDAYVGALLDTEGGQLHPLNYALGLADACQAAGVRLFEGTRATRLEAGDPAILATPRGRVAARFVLLAGNAYLGPLSPDVARRLRSRIMPVGTYMIATEPLSPAAAHALIPSGYAVADINFVISYYRLSRDNRMLFGGGVSYSTLERPDLGRALKRRMVRVFPSLAGARIDHVWGGYVAITLKRLPHLGRLAPNILFAQGYSGHGVAHAGIAGQVMAEAVAGTAERFDVFARIPHAPFPGGRLLRMPALVLAMTWYRLRDLL